VSIGGVSKYELAKCGIILLNLKNVNKFQNRLESISNTDCRRNRRHHRVAYILDLTSFRVSHLHF